MIFLYHTILFTKKKPPIPAKPVKVHKRQAQKVLAFFVKNQTFIALRPPSIGMLTPVMEAA